MEKMIKNLIDLINDKQGEQLVVFDVSEVTTTTKYVFIMTANSNVHGNSLSKNIIDFLIENDLGQWLMSRQVESNNPWILIDCSDFIFHVFQKEERKFYHLEKLYFRGKLLFQASTVSA